MIIHRDRLRLRPGKQRATHVAVWADDGVLAVVEDVESGQRVACRGRIEISSSLSRAEIKKDCGLNKAKVAGCGLWDVGCGMWVVGCTL